MSLSWATCEVEVGMKKLCRAGSVDHREEGLIGRDNNVSKDPRAAGVRGRGVVETEMTGANICWVGVHAAGRCTKGLTSLGPFMPHLTP